MRRTKSIVTRTTFQVAERVFQDETKHVAGGVLPGAAAFKLYDTYGLALDEQEEMAREAGLSIDKEGFQSGRWKNSARARGQAGKGRRTR